MRTKRSRGIGARASYRSYRKFYMRAKKRLAKKGQEMYDTLMSKAEYKDFYAQLVEERKTDMKMGKLKSIGNINRDIVASQTYKVRSKQARNLKNALMKYDIQRYGEVRASTKNLKIRDIQSGSANFDEIKAEYHYLMNEMGYSSKEASEYIAGEYFGS